jgi:hypothetical protein
MIINLPQVKKEAKKKVAQSNLCPAEATDAASE